MRNYGKIPFGQVTSQRTVSMSKKAPKYILFLPFSHFFPRPLKLGPLFLIASVNTVPMVEDADGIVIFPANFLINSGVPFHLILLNIAARYINDRVYCLKTAHKVVFMVWVCNTIISYRFKIYSILMPRWLRIKNAKNHSRTNFNVQQRSDCTTKIVIQYYYGESVHICLHG